MARKFDIILFAATGFTGKLIAEYLAQRVGTERRWALAGRNIQKLEALRTHLTQVNTQLNDKDITLFQADIEDIDSVNRVCRITRLVISAVGPYAKYGEPVVKSCVENKTDYIDVTGEPSFIRTMVEKYHAQAKANKVMVVHCCGIDSIPADLTTYFALHKLKEKIGRDLPVNVETFISLRTPSPLASLSNGTWTTVIQSLSNIRNNNVMKSKQRKSNTKKRSKTEKLSIRPHWSHHVHRWALPFPVADPFVVKRSSHICPDVYGDFEYAHYAAFRSLITFVIFMFAMFVVLIMSQFNFSRSLLYRLKTDGEGPPEEIRGQIGYMLDAVASEVDGQRQVVCRDRKSVV